MKKILFVTIAVATAMLASCKKNQPEDKPLTNVYFSEFSVLKADNGFIDQDYKFTNLDKTAAINITLPNTINPDSLQAVIFRFATTPADAIVSVDEQILEQKDTLSFVEPVEIRLAAGEDLWAYTVTISIAQSEKWAQVAVSPDTDTLYTSPTVGYDKTSGKFFVMDALRSKISANQNPVYYEFNGSALSDIKKIAEVEGTNGHAVDVLNGVPYFAYTDKSAATSTRVTVAKVENGQTSIIGNQGAIAKIVSSNPCVLIAESSNSIWYASSANEAYDGTTKRLLNLAKYDGSTWKNATALEGRPATSYGYGEYVKKVGNATYMLVCNQNTFSTSIYKLENGSWSTVYESLVPELPESIVAGTGTISYFQNFAVAADGSIYLCAQTHNAESVFNLCIQKYNAAENELELVSWIPQSSSAKGGIFPCMNIDKNGNPIVVFQGDKDARCFAAAMNTATKAYEVSPVSNLKSSDKPKIVADKDNNLYVFFESGAHLVVCKQL